MGRRSNRRRLPVRFLALSRGGGRLTSNWFDICYDHTTIKATAATYRVSENWLVQPRKLAQNGGRSLVGFCGNSTLVWFASVAGIGSVVGGGGGF